MNGLQNVRRVCEERVLMNVACYMFNAIYGLFNTISAYRTEGTPIVLVVVHLARVINCAGRITVICFAASSVVEQVSTYLLYALFKYYNINSQRTRLIALKNYEICVYNIH